MFEGWLTKSPPTKRIWRAKWRRRWFALRQSGELPGQYYLDYYADKNCRRRKGTINLDLCEQVDAGLHMNKSGSSSPRLRGSVFTVQTSLRTYHLEADCEADMEKWVDAICRVCGLRSTDEADKDIECVTYSANAQPPTGEERSPDSAGPYIPISECITGSRDPQRTFSFDTRDISGHMSDGQPAQVCTSQPQIRVNNAEFSDNDSSDDECKSLNNSQSNIGDWSVAKTFTKLTIEPNRNNGGDYEVGPPVPPRPPKTLTMGKDYYREPFYGPKLQEPLDAQTLVVSQAQVPRSSRRSHTITTGIPVKTYSPPKEQHFNIKHPDDEDEIPHRSNPSYCNVWLYPPAVDRALKPRLSSHIPLSRINEITPDTLQYLDLDLHVDKPPSDRPNIIHDRRRNAPHGKSLASVDTETIYKTVDFLKTEAFNITRQDAAALRKTAI